LKPGISRGQAQAELDLIMPRLSPVWRAAVIPLLDYYVGDVRTPLLVLLGAAGFVILIACVNVTNLQLARGSVRQNEISLRFTIGATRARLIRQLLSESLFLAAIGGGLGVLVAFGGIGALKVFVPTGIPRLDQVGLDARTLLFTMGLSAVAALMFGLLPALRFSSTDLQSHLSVGGRVAGVGSRGRLRYVFMVSETALALVLLAGSGLVLESFGRLLKVNPGFQPEKLLAATVNLPSAKYRQAALQVEFVNRLLDKLDGSPGVAKARFRVIFPSRAPRMSVFSSRGRPTPGSLAPPRTTTQSVPLISKRWGFPCFAGDSSPSTTLRPRCPWWSSMKLWRKPFSRTKILSESASIYPAPLTCAKSSEWWAT
jgi:putative ABC transport system permease protein